MHDNEAVRYEIDRVYRIPLGATLGFVGTGRWANLAKKSYFAV